MQRYILKIQRATNRRLFAVRSKSFGGPRNTTRSYVSSSAYLCNR